jgi:prepilin-type N-terminal cleavage/methylation domain-containing protein
MYMQHKNKGFTPHHFFGNGKSGKGFTLIELLVVIAIIGLLSSVVLASLASARTKARDARRISDIKQLKIALELYNDKYSTYPSAISGTELTTDGFMGVNPKDPKTQALYFYDMAVGGNSYCLGANLETSGHSALLSDAECFNVGASPTITYGFDASDCGGGANLYCYQISP